MNTIIEHRRIKIIFFGSNKTCIEKLITPLSKTGKHEISALAKNYIQARNFLNIIKPDLLIIENGSCCGDFNDLLKIISQGDLSTNVMIISGNEEPLNIKTTIVRVVKGYISDRITFGEFLHAIDTVISGSYYFNMSFFDPL